MGRSRRRMRREGHGNGGPRGDDEHGERLSPEYVTVAGQWGGEPVAPVLELEGLEPWDVIQGPALALEEALEEAPQAAAFLADSTDPDQLAFEPPIGNGEPERGPQRDAGEPDERDSAEFEAVAALEAITEATRADARAAAIVANLVARALSEAEAPLPAEASAPEPVPESVPDPVEQLYAEARAAAEEARLADAVRLYRELLLARPAHVAARNNLALLLDQQGDHQGALVELDRALEHDGENVTVLVNRGALLGAMGRFAAAERDLKRVLRVEPSHAEALFNLGVVMTRKGLWSEAVPNLKRAVELDPGRGPAHFYLGEALNHVDDLAGALAAYQRATELMPNNPRALYGLGIVYDRLGRPDDAAQMYRRSREIGRR